MFFFLSFTLSTSIQVTSYDSFSFEFNVLTKKYIITFLFLRFFNYYSLIIINLIIKLKFWRKHFILNPTLLKFWWKHFILNTAFNVFP